jgi:hypothetical protein
MISVAVAIKPAARRAFKALPKGFAKPSRPSRLMPKIGTNRVQVNGIHVKTRGFPQI